MADSFDSFEGFANHLRMVVLPNIPMALKGGLDELGGELVERAKSKFGIYQKAVYKYSRWKALSERTKASRLRAGYSADEPLLRSGATRDSIYYTVKGSDLVMGSSDQKMVYHELGTKSEPPRPVLGPTLYQAKAEIMQILGRATVIAVAPGLKLQKIPGFKRTGPRITSEHYDAYRTGE